ncbi:MAG: DNA polymerase III subunit beta [Elusimicrobia bacterium]|nr:DNA polymerase III subunit beta [Elusimicrobiota bacterium]
METIQSALSARTTLPILQNFLMETENRKIKFVSTDLEMGIKHYAAGDVANDGSITLPARKVSDILRSLSDDKDVELTVDAGGKVQLRCGRSHFSIIGQPKSDYPVLPEFNKANAFEVPGKVLALMIDKTIFSVSSDETRHVLNGVFWSAKKGLLEMVSTDGRRLSVVAKKIVPADKAFQVIVPTKVLTEIERTIKNQGSKEGDGENVLLTVNENQIGFQMKSTTMISRLLAGSFPNYQQVIPQKKDIMVTVGTEELLAVTKRAALAVGDRGGAVKYTLRRGALAVDAQSPNVECKDEISLEYDGPEFQAAFNPGFVVDALKHIDTEKTQLSMTSPVNPVLFEPAGGDDYRFVVMPMRA